MEFVSQLTDCIAERGCTNEIEGVVMATIDGIDGPDIYAV